MTLCKRLALLTCAAALTLLCGCHAAESALTPGPSQFAEQDEPPAGNAYRATPAPLPDGLTDNLFLPTYPVQTGESALDGAEPALSVLHIHGAQDGPAVYVVAGLHGNEPAGWQAGELLKGITLQAGDLYLVTPANPWGAAHNTRGNADGDDLNRAFGAATPETSAERTAAALLADIAEKSPALVFDLHEAGYGTESRDELARGLVCGDMRPVADLVFSLLDETAAGTLASGAYTLYASPPVGSLNRAVTNLGIACITVETGRMDAPEIRVSDHLALVCRALNFFEMR